MRRRILWLGLSCLMIAAVLLSSCTKTPATTATTTLTTTTTTTTTAATTATTTTSEEEMVKDFTGKLIEKPVYGGVLRPWFESDAGSFDPGLGTSIMYWTFGLVYEKLGIGDWTKAGMGTGEQMYGHPSYFDIYKYGKGNLAESYEMTDATTLTVHIRHGIHFQNKAPANGRELTAEDVRYCFQRYQDTSAAPADFRPYLQSITAPDKWTVVFKFNKPYAKAIEDIVFGRVFIYAPESITTYGNLNDWKNALGTGPFMLTDDVQNISQTYVANSNYWATDEIIPGNKLPYVAKVQSIIMSDISTIMASLRTGKVDTTFWVTPTSFKSLATATQLKYVAVPDRNVEPLVFFREDQPPFNDLRVRQAMSLAIDYQGIMKDYLGGNATPLCFPIMSIWPNYYVPLNEMPADIQELWSYNVPKAKALMAAAGYPNGYPSTIDLLSWPATEISDHMQLLAGYWKAIGINCNISTPDAATAVAKMWGKTYNGIGTVTAGITGPITCLAWETSTHTYDWSVYKNPTYDALIDKLLTTVDPDQQVPLVKQAVQMLYRDVVFLQFPAAPSHNVWQPWVKQFHGEICLGGLMGYDQSFARIWIDQELKESMGY